MVMSLEEIKGEESEASEELASSWKARALGNKVTLQGNTSLLALGGGIAPMSMGLR